MLSCDVVSSVLCQFLKRKYTFKFIIFSLLHQSFHIGQAFGVLVFFLFISSFQKCLHKGIKKLCSGSNDVAKSILYSVFHFFSYLFSFTKNHKNRVWRNEVRTVYQPTLLTSITVWNSSGNRLIAFFSSLSELQLKDIELHWILKLC